MAEISSGLWTGLNEWAVKIVVELMSGWVKKWLDGKADRWKYERTDRWKMDGSEMSNQTAFKIALRIDGYVIDK